MYLFRARVVQLFSITATAGTGLEWGGGDMTNRVAGWWRRTEKRTAAGGVEMGLMSEWR